MNGYYKVIEERFTGYYAIVRCDNEDKVLYKINKVFTDRGEAITFATILNEETEEAYVEGQYSMT